MFVACDRTDVMSTPLDEYLRLVADRNRRGVIRELRRTPDNTATFEELINRLHEEATDTDRAALAIELRHTHLPKLADNGLVEYDRRSGAVRYQPDDRVETLLDSLPARLSDPDETTV
jgi:DNA-binding transcriptional ArsR family regulator